jgi:hypothetical protein
LEWCEHVLLSIKQGSAEKVSGKICFFEESHGFHGKLDLKINFKQWIQWDFNLIQRNKNAKPTKEKSHAIYEKKWYKK